LGLDNAVNLKRDTHTQLVEAQPHHMFMLDKQASRESTEIKASKEKKMKESFHLVCNNKQASGFFNQDSRQPKISSASNSNQVNYSALRCCCC